MAIRIEDGKGRGYQTAVGSDNRLECYAITQSELLYHAGQGDSFAVSTNFKHLTNTSAYSGLFYLKNDSQTECLHIAGGRLDVDSPCRGVFIKNPTGGTLISTADSLDGYNLNFGSGKDPSITCYAGDNGYTITGGYNVVYSYFPTSSALANLSVVVLPPSKSMAISVIPVGSPANVCISISFFFKDCGIT